jgi:KTSC domain
MQRISVASSNLASVGYDPITQTLEIEFHNGGVYQYFGVPTEVYEGLVSAGSKGGYHAAYIRDSYSYSRVG